MIIFQSQNLALVQDKFTNDQYHTLQPDGAYKITSENSIVVNYLYSDFNYLIFYSFSKSMDPTLQCFYSFIVYYFI